MKTRNFNDLWNEIKSTQVKVFTIEPGETLSTGINRFKTMQLSASGATSTTCILSLSLNDVYELLNTNSRFYGTGENTSATLYFSVDREKNLCIKSNAASSVRLAIDILNTL